MKVKAALVALAVAAIASGSAFASATPVSPPPGARVGMHPVFSWTMPLDETADTLYIANRPETTPSGAFYEENVVSRGFVYGFGAGVWAPTQPLFAGARWWIVKTITISQFGEAYSPPSPFTVIGNARIRSLRVSRNSYTYIPSSLDVTVGWFSNAHNTTVTVGVYRGRRLVGRVRRVETRTVEWPVNETTYLTWRKPRGIRRGVRLRLVVSVGGAGAINSTSRFVRAP
jgi:hypothetical protein